MRKAFLISGSMLWGRPLALLVVLAIQGMTGHAAENIQFNTDVLDVSDRANIDLSRFSQAGYIMPGNYQMVIRLNKSELSEQMLSFMDSGKTAGGSQVCLTPDIVSQLGLKVSTIRNLKWWHNGQCLELESLAGLSARADLGESALYLNVPQAYLEYTSETWDPPSRWDDGVAGVILDYNFNAQTAHFVRDGGSDTHSLSGTGITGFNLGGWRFRADWQGQYYRTAGMGGGTEHELEWNRYYAYRAIPALEAKLMLGENYLNSGMFDSFRYVGSSLESDDDMLPPNLRGYAPEVAGVARTNAKVTISQQGRVIYETTVAAGPFRIQDLNNAVFGTLDVKVQEQDGSEHNFQIETANIPYLTRPGLVRYKLALGQPSDYLHNAQGPGFATGEFSWGVNNGWSLYGGSLLAGDYNALAMGVGRDLLMLGALSLDVTRSRAVLPHDDTKVGDSYRVSYSKRFDEYDSQVTFAGYRFSERNFLNMSEFLNARYHGISVNNNKEMYTLSFNKHFSSLGLSSYVNYSHQTYWNRPDLDNYNLSVSRYFDAGRFKNISFNVSAYRSLYNNTSDDGLYLSMSLPWGNGTTLNADSQIGSSGNASSMGYYGHLDNNNSYRVKAGRGNQSNGMVSAYLSHQGNTAEVTTSGSYEGGRYRALGLSLQGGITGAKQGIALHRTNGAGRTRMMVDSAGIGGVPVRGYGNTTNTNLFGKAVISDINSYYRSSVSVDVNQLADNVEATRSVVQGTLTEGAIGYRKFGIVAGEKAMVNIRLADGNTPPFGTTVMTLNGRQAGIVSDGGQVWLTGMVAGETMRVLWDGREQCRVSLPKPLPPEIYNMLLPCLV